MLNLDEILRGVGNCQLAFPVEGGLAFSHATNDSRQVKPGALFVALQGERDGHDFIADAYRRGASGVLAHRLVSLDWLPPEGRSRFAYVLADDSLAGLQRLATHRRLAHPARVIGVTGSVGKTTTKEAIAGLLARRFRVLKNEGNLNNEIGLPLTLLDLAPEHEVVVLEMGMYALGDVAALCRIAGPQIGVVTNVGVSHMERLGTVERIAQAKAELVDSLPLYGWAVLNGDDERVAAMRERSKAEAVTFGLGASNDFRAQDIVSRGLEGSSFAVRWGRERAEVSIRLAGQPGIKASLAAGAVALCLGFELSEVAAGLATLAPELRLNRLCGPNGSTILDDTYNASPASTLAALDLLAEHPGRRLAILGDMFELGSAEEEGHRQVGRRAAQVLDELIVVGQRARWIGEEAEANGLTRVQYVDSGEGANPDIQPGDIVLVKGSRGMRMETIVTRLRSGNGGSQS